MTVQRAVEDTTRISSYGINVHNIDHIGEENVDTWFMRLALEQAKRCTPVTTAYNVGAVLVSTKSSSFPPAKNGQSQSMENSVILSTGYSRELPGGTHAEECCFLKAAPPQSSSLTLYTTMEPCSTRLSGSTPCVDRILNIPSLARVVIGVREPEHFVICQGTRLLRDHGITVDYCPAFKEDIERLNSHLFR